MKRILHLTSTTVLILAMTTTGLGYLMKAPALVEAVSGTLDYPPYFLGLLGTAKLLGALRLAIPGGHLTREWAYAGFAFVLIAAVGSHVAIGEVAHGLAPAAFGLVLAASYATRSDLAVVNGQDHHRAVAVG